ncbi:L-rhamnose mutarotase [Aquirufa sp. HETE-40SA]
MQRFILLLDLIDDLELIRQYEKYHESIPTEIQESILASGIESMKMFRFENRLCMEILANDDFNFSQKAKMDADNPAVQAWETLMSNYQKTIPGTPQGAKWVLAHPIFNLTK